MSARPPRKPSQPQALAQPDPDEVIRAEFRASLNGNEEKTLGKMCDANGKIILNADDLFMMLPRYVDCIDDRKFLGPVLYQVAREFTDLCYKRLLKRPFAEDDTVIFTAGGSATGKSTILRAAGKNPGVSFIVDTTFSNLDRAVDQIEQALKTGRKVEVHFVHRDFKKSVAGMVRRAQDPKSGRIVRIDDMARTHYGAQNVILEILARYGANQRVSVELNENVGEGKLRKLTVEKFATLLHPTVDKLQKKGQGLLNVFRSNTNTKPSDDGDSDHTKWADIHVSASFYEAARSQAQT